jgi:hypothetical protein
MSPAVESQIASGCLTHGVELALGKPTKNTPTPLLNNEALMELKGKAMGQANSSHKPMHSRCDRLQPHKFSLSHPLPQ